MSLQYHLANSTKTRLLREPCIILSKSQRIALWHAWRWRRRQAVSTGIPYRRGFLNRACDTDCSNRNCSIASQPNSCKTPLVGRHFTRYDVLSEMAGWRQSLPNYPIRIIGRQVPVEAVGPVRDDTSSSYQHTRPPSVPFNPTSPSQTQQYEGRSYPPCRSCLRWR